MEEIPERIAIAGAGVAGAWLYRAMTDSGRDVEIYEVPERSTACGLHPCAWGVGPDLFRLMAGGPVDPGAFVTNRPARVDFEGRTVPGTVSLVNKPRLVRALLDGARIRREPVPAGCYDRVLDCTGAARAFLPPPRAGDVLGDTVQMRLEIPTLPDDTILLRYGRFGYCWAFPLGHHRFHVGAVGHLERCRDRYQMLRFAGLLDDENRMAGYEADRLCSCESTIRLTSPAGALPHLDPASPLGCPVWGVGESIGTVSPVTGEGIAHAMRCADLYLEHERDPAAYSDAVVREFSWMARERRIVERMMAGGWPSLADVRLLKQNAARMGIHVGVLDAVPVLATLLRQRRIRLSSLVPFRRAPR